MLTPHGMQAPYNSKVMIIRTILHPSKRSVDNNDKVLDGHESAERMHAEKI